jgi:hypothetical protein
MKNSIALLMTVLGFTLLLGVLALNTNAIASDQYSMGSSGNSSGIDSFVNSADIKDLCPMSISKVDVDKEKVGKKQGGVAFDFDAKKADRAELRDRVKAIAMHHPNSVLNLEQEPTPQGSGSSIAYSNVTYEARPGGARLIFWTEDQSKPAVISLRKEAVKEARTMNKTNTCSLDLFGATATGASTTSGRSQPEQQ